MNIATSPLTNRILVGKSKKLQEGVFQWVGKVEDITGDAILAVCEYMCNKAEEMETYSIFIEGYGTLTFRKGETP
jgi:hypothetical protein